MRRNRVRRWAGAGRRRLAARTLTGAWRLAAARALISDAGLRLGATLDLAGTARQIIDISVPRFAGTAAVFVLERFAAGQPPGRAGPEPEQVVARRLVAGFARNGATAPDPLFPDDEITVFRAGTPCERCVATGQPVRFSDCDGAMVMLAGPREAGGAPASSGYSRFLAVPMMTRGVVHGFLLFGRPARGRGFTGRDVDAARELSAVAAVSIDNALLYRREQRIADALQRGLLPADPARPDGLEVIHRYHPPDGQIVGGDWCDIVPLPRGRTALIVGDAMGHGAEAATVMAQLRAAASALAGLDLPPAAVLERLDDMAARLSVATFATCVYAVLNPVAGSCAITAAGHLPPVLAMPDGKTEMVDIPAGLPLGLGAAAFGTVEVTLGPGTVLALYTDGLVESRVRSFDEGVLALRDALTGCRGPLPGICDAVIGRLWEHGEDDTTLVLARIPSLPAQRPAPP